MIEENTRGDRFPHYPENVPEELKAVERWVTCDPYKAPLIAIPSGAVYAAKSTDPSTWRSYETAFETWMDNDHIAGVGRVIYEPEPYVGVDLDDCLNPDTGEVSSWASHIVEQLNSYAEISPSLTGVKIWTTAPEITRSYKKAGLEVYPHGRYFTLTGLLLGEPRLIRDAGSELAAIIEEEFPRVNRHQDYDGTNSNFDLSSMLERANIEVRFDEIDRSGAHRFSIRCPWAYEHSTEGTSDTRCGQYENGALFFKCEHSHCGHRDWWTFKDYLKAIVYLGRPPRSKRGRLR